MNIEKLLSLLVLLGISTTGLLIVACITYFISVGQYSGLIGIMSVLILFVCLVPYFYKNIE